MNATEARQAAERKRMSRQRRHEQKYAEEINNVLDHIKSHIRSSANKGDFITTINIKSDMIPEMESPHDAGLFKKAIHDRLIKDGFKVNGLHGYRFSISW